MEDMDNKIMSRVKKEVFPLFGQAQNSEVEARIILQKQAKGILQLLAGMITEECSTECNRFVFYNLAYVSMQLGEKTAAKFYSSNIKRIIESDEEYKNSNYGLYCNVLTIYIESNDITIQEKIEINKRNLDYYEKHNMLEGYFVSKSNECILNCILNEDKDILGEVVEIIVNIHRRLANCTKDDKDLRKELKSASDLIFMDLEKHSKYHSKEVLTALECESYIYGEIII